MQRFPNAAFLSVTDKTGLIELGKAIANTGRPCDSTGGTADELRKGEITVRDASEITGFPSIMGGRLKTLHPNIFGGILYDRNEEQHIIDARTIGITHGYDIVVVNLYDFTGKPSIERIDIGGPSLIRAAAKNWESGVAVVTHPEQYKEVIGELEATGNISVALRQWLAYQAFVSTRDYDTAIATWFMEEVKRDQKERFHLHMTTTPNGRY